MRRRLSRAEQQGLTRTRLLDVAEAAFSTRGYHQASLEAIAEEAGYSKGAVYSNFGSKGDLFLALMDRKAEAEEAALTADHGEQVGPPTGVPGSDSLGWALATLDFFLVAVHDPTLRAALAGRYREARARLGRLLVGDRHRVRWGSPDEAAAVAMALGSGLLIQAALEPEAVAPDLYGRALNQLMDSSEPEPPRGK